MPIGKLIQERLESVGMSKAELARRLHMSPVNVYKIFKRDTIEITQLCRISEALRYDFLELYRREVIRLVQLNSRFEIEHKPSHMPCR